MLPRTAEFTLSLQPSAGHPLSRRQDWTPLQLQASYGHWHVRLKRKCLFTVAVTYHRFSQLETGCACLRSDSLSFGSEVSQGLRDLVASSIPVKSLSGAPMDQPRLALTGGFFVFLRVVPLTASRTVAPGSPSPLRFTSETARTREDVTSLA